MISSGAAPMPGSATRSISGCFSFCSHWPPRSDTGCSSSSGFRCFSPAQLIRTRVEDQLLEQTFGDAFRDYRNSTPALLPRLF